MSHSALTWTHSEALHFSRTPGEPALMRPIQLSLDPHHLLTQGKIIQVQLRPD